VDFGETFSPFVKPATVRTLLHLSASQNCPVHQLDVSNAFLNGVLTERVFCQQPTGFDSSAQPDHVCLLAKSLYGLRQAPRAWYTRIGDFLRSIGFITTRSDTSLFVMRHGSNTAYLLLYVDDIIHTASSTEFLRSITQQLQSEFKMKDLSPLHFFLGFNVRRTSSRFFLSQERYAKKKYWTVLLCPIARVRLLLWIESPKSPLPLVLMLLMPLSTVVLLALSST
jgi:hypothetical protein